MFYIYALIPNIIAVAIAVFSWEVTHYFIREIDKNFYIKGYTESIKYPKKIIYMIAQILILILLAVIPIFLIAQVIRDNEKMKKQDRLLAYHLYISSIIGIYGFKLIMHLFSQLAGYWDFNSIQFQVYILSNLALYLIVPYYLILGMKNLYRLSKNNTVQITKYGYQKESGIKKSDFLQNLFKSQLKGESKEEAQVRLKELRVNWHFRYENEEEWMESKEVKNDFTKITSLFTKLLIIIPLVNIIIFLLNGDLLQRDVISVSTYNNYVYKIVKFIYTTEYVIIGMYLLNFWLGSAIKKIGKLQVINVRLIINGLALIILFIVVSDKMKYSVTNPIEDGTLLVRDGFDIVEVEPNEEGIKFAKDSYIESVKHSREYDSFTMYEKTHYVMEHPKKFAKTIEKVGQDRVSSPSRIYFSSENLLNSPAGIAIKGRVIRSYDGTEEDDNFVEIRISFGEGEPELCGKEPTLDYGSVYLSGSGKENYDNPNLCALEHDMVNTVESFYSEVFDHRMLGIKSDYVAQLDDGDNF